MRTCTQMHTNAHTTHVCTHTHMCTHKNQPFNLETSSH